MNVIMLQEKLSKSLRGTGASGAGFLSLTLAVSRCYVLRLSWQWEGRKTPFHRLVTSEGNQA